LTINEIGVNRKYNPNLKDNLIVNLTFQFSLDIIKFVEFLEKNHKYAIANQLLRSGTSIGANVREAQNAESKADFIHKLKIAAKEADEAEYWLELCDQSESYPNCKELLSQILSIKKVLSKIIASSKTSTNK
jgi:four helix bundle protein